MRIFGFLLVPILGLATGCNSRNAPEASVHTDPITTSNVSPSGSTGHWKVDTDTNAVTGEVTTTAYLLYQGKQNIYVRQKGKKLECYITTDAFLETVATMNAGSSPVVYRFNAGKPIHQRWHESADHEGLFYPGNPKPFLAQMGSANSLSFQYSPADKEPDVITFDVSGFPKVFK